MDNIALQHAQLKHKYEKLKSETELKVATLLAEAYADGIISGKNQDERSRSEAEFLFANKEYRGIAAGLDKAKYEHLMVRYTYELAMNGYLGVEPVPAYILESYSNS